MADPTAGSDLVAHLRARAVREASLQPGRIEPDTLAGLVEDYLDEERRILPEAQRRAIVQAVVDETLGFGPLEALLRDPAVTEVMVNGPDAVFVERGGRIEPAAVRFTDAAHVLHVIDRILSPLGRRIDEASPMVDARLPDGSRQVASRRAIEPVVSELDLSALKFWSRVEVSVAYSRLGYDTPDTGTIRLAGARGGGVTETVGTPTSHCLGPDSTAPRAVGQAVHNPEVTLGRPRRSASRILLGRPEWVTGGGE